MSIRSSTTTGVRDLDTGHMSVLVGYLVILACLLVTWVGGTYMYSVLINEVSSFIDSLVRLYR